MRRRRSRRRSGPPLARVVPVVLVAVVVVGLLVGPLASGATSAGAVGRGTGSNVTDDASGAHALDVAAAVHVNATDPLVNVTNRLGRTVTVTVELREDSTDVGDLVVDGTTRGNATSFTLSAGATETVELSIPDDSSLVGRTVYFHANASDPGLDVTATDRSAPVEG